MTCTASLEVGPRRLARAVQLAVLAAILLLAGSASPQSLPEALQVDAGAPGRPLPHFWEQMFGSGRASLTLRDAYRRDLRVVKRITDFSFVRFHAIFLDDMGVYDEDAQARPVFNFSYVDQSYDGLLEQHVRPFVEISFMPKKLAAKEAIQAFWYQPNVAPPKDWAKWDALIEAFTRHLVERYGEDEVARWRFEVWNEPNIDFWAGDPKQPTYFQLYDHTAAAIKRVSPRLRVGGPATAQAAWVDAFIRHCVDNQLPLDFVSTHVYGNDRAQDVFGTDENIARDQMVCRAVNKVHDQIKASARPKLPLIWSEFNASYKNEPAVTDSVYMGPWLADTIRQCDGLVDVMSYWTFSDVFEEQGVVKEPFYGGFGLLAAGGLPKPAFNAFRLLHLLGGERVPLSSKSALLTRRSDGALVLALWNLVAPGETGAPKTMAVQFTHLKAGARAYVSRLDSQHGDLHGMYEKLGSPRYPTRAQIEQLQNAAQLPPPEVQEVKGPLSVTLPPNGLAVIEVK